MCIEREKDNFKSREVNCLKECALALITISSSRVMDTGGDGNTRNPDLAESYVATYAWF